MKDPTQLTVQEFKFTSVNLPALSGNSGHQLLSFTSQQFNQFTMNPKYLQPFLDIISHGSSEKKTTSHDQDKEKLSSPPGTSGGMFQPPNDEQKNNEVVENTQPHLSTVSQDQEKILSPPAAGKSECSQPQNFEVDNTPLGEDDLLDITDYLCNMEKIHIYNLGLVLGLTQTKVKAKMDSATFLDDVIAAWLRKEDKVTEKGEPSWRVLVNALKHPRLGQLGIANKIANEKRCKTLHVNAAATSFHRGHGEGNNGAARGSGHTHTSVDNTSRKATRGKSDHSQLQNLKWENVDDTPLDEHSLRIVLDSISTTASYWFNLDERSLRMILDNISILAAGWFNLGVALGLSPGTLRTIESDHRGDSHRCLTEMVIAWLMQGYSQPSWQSLVSALSSPSVNRIEIATMIAAEHPSH